MLVIEMDSITSLAKNTFVLLISRIVLITLGFFYTLYTARYLGTEGYGILSFALALGGIFNVFSDMGLSTLATREVARNLGKSNEYLSNFTAIKTILIILASAAVIVFVNISGYPQQTIIVVYLITIYYIMFSFVTLFYSIFQAYEKMEYMSLGAIINSVMMLAGALAAIYFRFDIITFSSIYCVSIGTVLVFCLVVCMRKFFKFRLVLSREVCKRAIIETWPMGAMAVCTIICFRISTVIMSMVKGDTAVGLYSAAYTLSDTTAIVPMILGTSIFPMIARYHMTSRPLFILAYEKSIKYLFYLALPMALIVTIWAGPIIQVIYGADYSGSVVALQILIWSAALLFVTLILGTIFITANLQMANLKISIAAAALNIIFNLVAIPMYGISGASAAAFVTTLFTLITSVYVLEKLKYSVDMVNLFVVPTIGAMMAGLGCLVLVQLQFNLVLATLVCIAIYLTVVLAKGINKEDLELIDRLISPSGRIKRWTHRQ